MLTSNQELTTRMWNKDATLWSVEDAQHQAILNRLGWLDAPVWMKSQLNELLQWVSDTLVDDNIRRIVVLGMGGSSLAPEVLAQSLPERAGFPKLMVLDSTAPEMVQEVLEMGLDKMLFIVASKSGTTLETANLYQFFWHAVSEKSEHPGNQFVAITDSGSWLAQHANEAGFSKIFINPSDIGGRYSALSYFGMVPAALAGYDVEELLNRSINFAETTRQHNGELNQALALGCFLANQALQGRNKMLLRISRPLSSLGIWIEQLIAESTGKLGKGILPVLTTELATEYLGDDSFEIEIYDSPEKNHAAENQHRLTWFIPDPLDIGAEFFKWEFAAAIAAHFLVINPFDEPNVAEAKQSTNRFIKSAKLLDTVIVEDRTCFEVHVTQDHTATQVKSVVNHLAALQAGDYLGLLAYLPMDHETERALEKLRRCLVEKLKVPCTVGFGPRYLHSTGQFHKGGPPCGRFIQLTCAHSVDFQVPDSNYSFSQLLRAQADGDLSVLDAKELAVMRVVLKGDRLQSIQDFTNSI